MRLGVDAQCSRGQGTTMVWSRPLSGPDPRELGAYSTILQCCCCDVVTATLRKAGGVREGSRSLEETEKTDVSVTDQLNWTMKLS